MSSLTFPTAPPPKQAASPDMPMSDCDSDDMDLERELEWELEKEMEKDADDQLISDVLKTFTMFPYAALDEECANGVTTEMLQEIREDGEPFTLYADICLTLPSNFEAGNCVLEESDAEFEPESFLFGTPTLDESQTITAKPTPRLDTGMEWSAGPILATIPDIHPSVNSSSRTSSDGSSVFDTTTPPNITITPMSEYPDFGLDFGSIPTLPSLVNVNQSGFTIEDGYHLWALINACKATTNTRNLAIDRLNGYLASTEFLKYANSGTLPCEKLMDLAWEELNCHGNIDMSNSFLALHRLFLAAPTAGAMTKILRDVMKCPSVSDSGLPGLTIDIRDLPINDLLLHLNNMQNRAPGTESVLPSPATDGGFGSVFGAPDDSILFSPCTPTFQNPLGGNSFFGSNYFDECLTPHSPYPGFNPFAGSSSSSAFNLQNRGGQDFYFPIQEQEQESPKVLFVYSYHQNGQLPNFKEGLGFKNLQADDMELVLAAVIHVAAMAFLPDEWVMKMRSSSDTLGEALTKAKESMVIAIAKITAINPKNEEMNVNNRIINIGTLWTHWAGSKNIAPWDADGSIWELFYPPLSSSIITT